MSAQDDDLSGFKRTAAPDDWAPNATAAPRPITDFNPFAALGLHAATATASQIRPAYRRAMLHRHENAVLRFPTTASAFPSQVQVTLAYQCLSHSAATLAAARIRWGHRQVLPSDFFNPTLPVGDPRVFGAAAAAFAAAPASAAAPAAPAATPPAPPPRPRFSPTAASPRKARKTTATSTPGSTSDNPYSLSDTSDSSDSSDDDAPRPATPTPAARPSAAAAPPAATGPGRKHPLSVSSAAVVIATTAVVTAAAPPAATAIVTGPPPATPATPFVAPARAPRSGNRSGGSAARMAAIVNPVTDVRIVVGTFMLGPGATPNAVVAGFDRAGRMFYRITNRTLAGVTQVAPTATAVRFESIHFRAPYQGLDARGVRDTVDRHCRLPEYQRP